MVALILGKKEQRVNSFLFSWPPEHFFWVLGDLGHPVVAKTALETPPWWNNRSSKLTLSLPHPYPSRLVTEVRQLGDTA
jgi:hypothetical protein